MSVEKSIEEALETFKERGQQYSGDTWDEVGEITRLLYPNGILLRTREDFARFHIMQWLVGKLVRFARRGDRDSIKDAGVYAFILHSLTEIEDD